MAGYIVSHRFSLRVEFLKSYLHFIKYAETEIRYSKSVVCEIINQCQIKGVFSSFLNECKMYLLSCNPVDKAWENALSKVSYNFGLTKNDVSMINNFGINLGKCDAEGQIAYCKLAADLANLHLRESIEEKEKKSKLYFMLCLFFGLSFILLVL